MEPDQLNLGNARYVLLSLVKQRTKTECSQNASNNERIVAMRLPGAFNNHNF